MTTPSKRCQVCDARSVVTRSECRRSWRDNPYCRTCRYVMDIFSMNGTRLKEYGM